MTVLIEATGLQKGFAEGDHRVEVLRGVDLDLWTGEMTALAGPSGSGKSVLLDLLAGWSLPDAGQVRWREASATPGWAELAFVPQALGLLPDLTAWHNVVLPLRLDRGAAGLREETPRARALLERLGLDHLRDRSPDELSFGEQQRVAVARAVVLDPMLVLADEPTSHQDERSADAVMGVLREVCARGGGVLLASHDDDILARSDRVVRLVNGLVEEAQLETG